MKARDSHPAPSGSYARTRAKAETGPAPNDETLAGNAEVVLLSTDGADFRRVAVDAAEGVVTLHGTVSTESEKQEAAAAVRNLDGVHEVNNRLEVAPEPAPRARRGAPARPRSLRT